jgi:hypothetical protein
LGNQVIFHITSILQKQKSIWESASTLELEILVISLPAVAFSINIIKTIAAGGGWGGQE